MSFKNVFDKKTHCQELGVPLDATLKQIKTAYRMLALRYHPDKNPGVNEPAATKKFLRVKAAYDYLQKNAGINNTMNDGIDDILLRSKKKFDEACNNIFDSVFSSNFFTFDTASLNNQPPIRHNLLLTFEEYLHGTVKKLLFKPLSTAIQQQKKLLEVRVFAGATPGDVLWGRVLQVGNFVINPHPGGDYPEDHSIAVVLGDKPNQKFTRFPLPDSAHLNYVYKLTKFDMNCILLDGLLLTVPTLSEDAITPGPLIYHRVSLNSILSQTLPTVCAVIDNQGLRLDPNLTERGIMRVELLAPLEFSFENLFEIAKKKLMQTTATLASKQSSKLFVDNKNKIQQQQKTFLKAKAKVPKQSKTPMKAKTKVTQQPKTHMKAKAKMTKQLKTSLKTKTKVTKQPKRLNSQSKSNSIY